VAAPFSKNVLILVVRISYLRPVIGIVDELALASVRWR